MEEEKEEKVGRAKKGRERDGEMGWLKVRE